MIIFRCRFSLLQYLSLLLIIIGCATSPNNPYEGPYPDSLVILKEQNPLLVEELAKLPELQDGIDQNEDKAVLDLCGLYNNNPKIFNHAFEQMYKVGKPEVRKYSSPLQAFYWLFEDGKKREADHLVSEYSLDDLLNVSWGISGNSEMKANSLWQRLEDPVLKGKIVEYMENDIDLSTTNDYIIKLARENLKAFGIQESELDYASGKKNSEAIQKKNEERWSDMGITIDRLNSPELVDYYIDNNMSYVFHQEGDVCCPPSRVFKRKEGCCSCLTYFGKKALDNAGYKTQAIMVWGPGGTHVGLYSEENGEFMLEIDFDRSETNSRRGPYHSKKKVIQEIGAGAGGVHTYKFLHQQP